MGADKKLERKIQVMRKYLKRACTSCSGYLYGDIPSNKFQGACRSYAGNITYTDVIGLTDETIFGGGEKGMLFVKDGYYCDNMTRKVLYTERKHHKVSSSLYNQTVMKEMLNELASIDEEPSGWDIAASIFSLGLEILQAASDSSETQEDSKKN